MARLAKSEVQVVETKPNGAIPPNLNGSGLTPWAILVSNNNNNLERRGSWRSGGFITRNHAKSPLLQTLVVRGCSSANYALQIFRPKNYRRTTDPEKTSRP